MHIPKLPIIKQGFIRQLKNRERIYPFSALLYHISDKYRIFS